MLPRWMLAAFVIVGSAGLSRASEIETARMTSPEIRDAVSAGFTTVLIPTGGTEQNGRHMVTGKHNYIVAETARRIAARLGKTLIAPVMAYVPEGDIASREGHMAYAGTISVPPDVYIKVLEAAAESFEAHGFKTIVFLGDSGPNQAPQRAAAAELSRAWVGRGVRVLNADDYYANNGQQGLLKAEGETDASIGLHAGIRDTSELLAVAPDGVRADRLAADVDGASGDPRRSTAERGEKLLALKVEAAVKEIESARSAVPVMLPGATPAAQSQGGGLWDAIWRLIFG